MGRLQGEGARGAEARHVLAHSAEGEARERGAHLAALSGRGRKGGDAQGAAGIVQEHARHGEQRLVPRDNGSARAHAPLPCKGSEVALQRLIGSRDCSRHCKQLVTG